MRNNPFKAFGFGVALALIGVCTPVSAAKENLKFDATRPLLTRHSTLRKHAESELNAVLEDLFAEDAGVTAKPLVVYVHGRGHEPKKSFDDSILGTKNRVIEKIEQRGVLVLGVGWDSAPSLVHPSCSRPIDRASAAGPLFARTVHALVAHRAGHEELWRNRKVILLVHSMGGFVLRDAMERPGVPADIAALFDTRIISESDVPAADHLKWIPSSASGHTYVVTNPRDGILARSTRCDKAGGPDTGPRLGTLAAVNVQPSLVNVTYIQLAAGKRHRVFTKGGADKNPFVCRVMGKLLTGADPELDASWRLASNAYSVPAVSHSKDACFRGALTDKDGKDD